MILVHSTFMPGKVEIIKTKSTKKKIINHGSKQYKQYLIYIKHGKHNKYDT